jgi:hypothetical protein
VNISSLKKIKDISVDNKNVYRGIINKLVNSSKENKVKVKDTTKKEK